MKCGRVAGWDGTREQDSTAVPLTKPLSSLKKGRPSPPLHPPPSAQLHLPSYLKLTEYSQSRFHFLCISYFQASIFVFTGL